MERRGLSKCRFSGRKPRCAALLLCFFLMTIFFCGCGEEGYTPETLTVALSRPFDNSFNYYETESESNRAVIELVAGTLLRESPGGGYEPYLGSMEAEEQDGKLVVTLTLKKGVRFSNGRNATIDDLIFLYTILADPGYTGAYSDFWESPIEGLAAYYWDDPSGTGEVPDFDAQARERYAPDKISEEDLKTYLRETNLEGEYNGNPNAYRSDGLTWAEFISEQGHDEELNEVMSNGAGVLDLLVDIYYENYADRYDAVEWYARSMKREYMKASTADGVDVESISGIVKLDDYTCRVTLTDPNADYIAILNRPLLSSANYRFTNKGGGDAAASSYTRSPLVGAGPYIFDKWEDGIVTLRRNSSFSLGKSAYETVRIRYADGKLIPLNCSLRQFACGFYSAEEGSAGADTAGEIETLAAQYGLSCVLLRDGALVYNPADADFSPLLSGDAGETGRNALFSRLWQVAAGT